ncbi:capsule synthesis protein PGA_cap [Stackebrandtia albiflava]|uniref:Capsule synthesis protein PGA_cap n=1 Tax=Stackebrandtia albiflava TaxID=406432 RepID=A0A562VCC0_9ACTN|nr:CapA family protein [Stackebrandtia albiflava]TWJ15510.1 capsule synthesis protein PGA_cap [Stackebrandtia albiflava]
MNRPLYSSLPDVLRHPAVMIAGVVVATLAVIVSAMALVAPGPATATLSPGAGPSPVADTDPDDPVATTVDLAAVGDTIMGDHPHALPPGGGEGFFDGVADELTGDVVFGNLEGPLSTRSDFSKCVDDTACEYIRMPPEYAPILADAGFDVLNIANNHGYDAGPAGVTDTRDALAAVGIPLSGMKGEITELETDDGVTVAVVGVAAYDFYTNLLDLQAVSALVSAADARADVVVLSMHIGAEGTDARHVTGAPEEFYGESRGDSLQVGHTAVDAGADLVIGHGPHVLRGIEFYKGRIIAHSLGNFAGYGVLASEGALGRGAVLKVTTTADGEFVTGSVTATHMVDGGYPVSDPSGGAFADFNELAADFGPAGVTVDPSGGLLVPQD